MYQNFLTVQLIKADISLTREILAFSLSKVLSVYFRGNVSVTSYWNLFN